MNDSMPFPVPPLSQHVFRDNAVSGPYDQDGLSTVHNNEFMDSPAFVAAYQRGVLAAGKDYGWHWRVHIGLWAAFNASKLPGDFVECGVNRGFMSSSIMQFLDWDRTGKTFYLLDTFAGIDERYVSEEEKRQGTMQNNRQNLASGFYLETSEPARTNFAEWSNVEIIEGAVPETLPRVRAERVAFLHLDMNCAIPEVTALDFFWERLVPGALVLMDDHSYRGFRMHRAYLDALAEQKNSMIVSLPTGQGMLIKHA